jgi:hypothetical protein
MARRRQPFNEDHPGWLEHQQQLDQVAHVIDQQPAYVEADGLVPVDQIIREVEEEAAQRRERITTRFHRVLVVVFPLALVDVVGLGVAGVEHASDQLQSSLAVVGLVLIGADILLARYYERTWCPKHGDKYK